MSEQLAKLEVLRKEAASFGVELVYYEFYYGIQNVKLNIEKEVREHFSIKSTHPSTLSTMTEIREGFDVLAKFIELAFETPEFKDKEQDILKVESFIGRVKNYIGAN